MNRKKVVLYALAGLVLLLFVVLISVALAIDSIVRTTVETVGPNMTRTAFTLERVDIRLLNGSGKLNGLFIGNPEKYSATFAMKIDEALLDIHPGSLFRDKLIVESIVVRGPEITFEGGASENNLRDIAANIGEFIGSPEERARLDRRLQVNHFRLTNAKVHVRVSLFGMNEITLAAPDIELHDLGIGADGITSAELTELIVSKISEEIGAVITARLVKGATMESSKEPN